MDNGKFVISLDFEMHWGFFDNRTLTNCRTQLSNTTAVIDKLLLLSNQYQTSITFATVGMMFAKNKDEVSHYIPAQKPQYENKALDAYALLDTIADADQKFYFAPELIRKIEKDTRHEIGTHTFSHYYCHENGQTIEDFNADLVAAKAVASGFNNIMNSIVFPRNQVQESYLQVCEALGIINYRGNCWFNFNNNPHKLKLIEYSLIILRVIDSYINLTGSNSFKLDDYNDRNAKLTNIPASRFLRPFNSKLKTLEPLKIKRIKNAMTRAAKRNEVYHLWWHPHNFANDSTENFENFTAILQHYQILKKRYNFESMTMRKLGEVYRSSNNSER